MSKRPLSPAQRSLQAQVAAHTRWAKEVDATTATQPARDGLLARFEREVDPTGQMDPADRRKRAQQLRRAHMQRLALKSSQARAAKRGAA